MSNSLAISVVTAALQQLIADSVREVVPGAEVTTQRPDEPPGAPRARVNIFLYQVTPNAARRNEAYPSRGTSGELVRRPQAVLDLHYLLSFYGDDKILEPQRLMGSAVAGLEARPAITAAAMRQLVERSLPDSFLRRAEIGEGEAVRISPLALDLEGLSKLWFFFKAPYALSTAYQASAVVIEAEGNPGQALPVRRRGVGGAPLSRQPVLSEAHAAEGRGAPILAGGGLVLLGRGLAGDPDASGGGPRALIGDLELPLEDASDARATLRLTDPALRAGVHGVRLARRSGVTSNAVAIVLRPRITALEVAQAPSASVARPVTITAAVQPPIAARQRAELLLNELGSDEPAAYTFEATEIFVDGRARFNVVGVKPAAYLARVRVDGADSPLEVDEDPASPTSGQYVRPRIEITGGQP